jgi:hypothetical protein
MRAAPAWLASVLIALGSPVRAAEPSPQSVIQDAAVDAAVRQLRAALAPQRDGSHLDLLRSLRSLRDPSLAAVFSRLTTNDDPLIRVNGILGLAELHERRRVDPWLVRSLEQESTRLRAIGLAIGFDLIGVEEMRTMLAWDDLQDAPRLALLAELVKRRETVDAAEVRRLADSPVEGVRGLGSCLLVQIENDRTAFDRHISHLDALEGQARVRARGELVLDIGRYRLDTMLWWVEQVVAEPGVDAVLALAAVETAIQLDVEAGLRLWRSRLDADRSYSNVVQHALTLFALASEFDIPAAAFEAASNGDALPDAIAKAGAAFANRAGAADALRTVVDLDHFRSSASALFLAERLDDADAQSVCVHAIGRVEASRHRPQERELIAVRATEILFERDPAAVERLLAATPDDSRTQEVILMGLLSSESPRAGELAAGVPRIGFGRADSLAIALMAKHAETLTPDQLKGLGLLASGAGMMSPSLQVQAAWLYLRHADLTELAMAKLFAEG